MSKEQAGNFFPPTESGEQLFGAVEYWTEGTLGVIATSGIIDYDHHDAIQAAVIAHMANEAVECIVFDFFNAAFLHSSYAEKDGIKDGIIVDAHKRALKHPNKSVKLRNLINPNTPEAERTNIFQLLEPVAADKKIAIEDIIPPSQARKWSTGTTHGGL
jgi:hypothetical protein